MPCAQRKHPLFLSEVVSSWVQCCGSGCGGLWVVGGENGFYVWLWPWCALDVLLGFCSWDDVKSCRKGSTWQQSDAVSPLAAGSLQEGSCRARLFETLSKYKPSKSLRSMTCGSEVRIQRCAVNGRVGKGKAGSDQQVTRVLGRCWVPSCSPFLCSTQAAPAFSILVETGSQNTALHLWDLR